MLPLFAGLLATPLGKLLAGIVALAVVVLAARIVLNVAWKLLVIAAVVVGAVYTVNLLVL